MDIPVGSPTENPPPRMTIFLVSATALAYEILLMRLFSIVQYHHFAYMVISIALLGYGASGTFLTIFRERLLRNFPVALIGNIVLFGLTATACYFGGQHLLFNPDELLWRSQYWLKIFVLYLLLALPFFFAANCTALSFSCFRGRIPEVYGADLSGAGLGSILIIGLLFWTSPQNCLILLGGAVFIIPLITLFELQGKLPRWSLLFLLPPTILLLLPSGWREPAISPYKGLSQQMRIPGSRIIEEHSSPLALLTVVENRTIPFRYAPGLSLLAASEPPDQLGIFTDGDGLSVITRFPDYAGELAYLDMVTSALPYHLHKPRNILVLGTGGGSDILQALHFGTASISAVELNPQIIEMVRARPEFSGRLFDRANIRINTGEARHFIAGSRETYDLIQVPFLDAFGSSAAGLRSLNENYLYTVEAITDYVRHLSPAGYLCLNSWIKLPPRDSLKLFATAVQSLRSLGIGAPGNHVVMIRSWQSGTLLIKKSPFRTGEIAALKIFCSERLFDLVYYPGIMAGEANRFNILQEPYFHRGAVSLLQEDPRAFMADYKFNIEPATDDKPFFGNFFKWRTLPEIAKLRGRGGLVLVESGYLILAATLIQAVAASFILVLLPVLVKTLGEPGQKLSWNRPRTALYFSAIGLAFLFLEIALMQKFILYLGHPLYAAAAVLAIFLIFAGLGSLYVKGRRLSAPGFAAIIILLGLLELSVSGPLFGALGEAALPGRLLVTVLMLGPLAFCMGMPFPLALADISAETPALVPWAWAVNGCASVAGAVLAALLAVHFGFTAVICSALILYAIAAMLFPAGQKAKGTS